MRFLLFVALVVCAATAGAAAEPPKQLSIVLIVGDDKSELDHLPPNLALDLGRDYGNVPLMETLFAINLTLFREYKYV